MPDNYVTKSSPRRIMIMRDGTGQPYRKKTIHHNAEVILMKIVVVKSPKALAPILRLLFKIKKES